LLLNVIEYLLGATDLNAIKAQVKKNLPTGKKCTFRARVHNQEANYCRNFKVSFYLSRDKKLQTGKDLLLGTVEAGEISGFGTRVIKLNATVPDDYNPGAYYLIAIVEGDGTYIEVDPDNSTALRRTNIY
jgi:hypothetical protein